MAHIQEDQKKKDEARKEAIAQDTDTLWATEGRSCGCGATSVVGFDDLRLEERPYELHGKHYVEHERLHDNIDQLTIDEAMNRDMFCVPSMSKDGFWGYHIDTKKVEEEGTRTVPLFLEDECSICLEDYKKGSRVAMKRCGHTFHGYCVTKLEGECPL